MKVEDRAKAQFIRFDVESYKQRLADAVDAAGGVTKLADKIGMEYQKVQGWLQGSLPRVEHWPLLENTGKGMAWYLFGIEGEMPNEKNMDRRAAVAAIKKLQEDLNALLQIVREPVPDAMVERAGFTKQRKPRASKKKEQ